MLVRAQRWHNRPAFIAFVCDAPRRYVFIGLVPPHIPAFPGITGKQFQIRSGRTRFDQVVLFIRLSGMFTFPGFDHVHLRSAWRESPKRTAHSEKDDLCDVAKIESYAPTIGASVLS